MLETMQPSTLALVVKWKIPSCSLVLAYPLYIGQHHSGYEICNSSTKFSYPFRLKFKAMTKGQLISKGLFDVIVSTKKTTIFF